MTSIDKAEALAAIRAAQTTGELEDARFDALAQSRDITRLTNAIAGMLLANGVLDTVAMNDLSLVYAQIKDTIADNILSVDFDYLRAVDTATMNKLADWRKQAYTPVERPDMSRYKGVIQDFLKTIEAIDKEHATADDVPPYIPTDEGTDNE